jgi:predicted DNA-binding transcriptional regulator AlpA
VRAGPRGVASTPRPITLLSLGVTPSRLRGDRQKYDDRQSEGAQGHPRQENCHPFPLRASVGPAVASYPPANGQGRSRASYRLREAPRCAERPGTMFYALTMTEDEELMTEEQVAKLLTVSVSTVKRLRVSGEGPRHIRISERVVRYRRQDVLDWMRQRAEEP